MNAYAIHIKRVTCLIAFVIVALDVLVAETTFATDYYVSSSNGDDLNLGTAPAWPWKTLKRASKAKLQPGDKLLFRNGDTFSGMLKLDVQGDTENKIVIGAYSHMQQQNKEDASRPVLDGQGAEASVLLTNPAYIVVRDLELTNKDGHFGIRLTAQNCGELNSVVLKNLEIHDVFDQAWSFPEVVDHGDYKRYGGINVQVFRDENMSRWNGLIIQNCSLYHLGSCAISIASDYPIHSKLRKKRRTEPYPILGLVIQGNRISNIARDGVVIRQCHAAIAEGNSIERTGQTSMANGIWIRDCTHCVMHHNIGSKCGVKGKADGSPFSIDSYCDHCAIRDNYSHDNEGPAFMVFGNDQTGSHSIVSGNVSYNDATVEQKPGFAAVTMVSTLSQTLVENNIVVAGPQTRALLAHHNWDGLPENVTYHKNIFVGNEKATIDASALPGATFKDNLFAKIPDLPKPLRNFQSNTDTFMEQMQTRIQQIQNEFAHKRHE